MPRPRFGKKGKEGMWETVTTYCTNCGKPISLKVPVVPGQPIRVPSPVYCGTCEAPTPDERTRGHWVRYEEQPKVPRPEEETKTPRPEEEPKVPFKPKPKLATNVTAAIFAFIITIVVFVVVVWIYAPWILGLGPGGGAGGGAQTWQIYSYSGQQYATLYVGSSGNFTGSGWEGYAAGIGYYDIDIYNGVMSGNSISFDVYASYGSGSLWGTYTGSLNASFPSANSASGTGSGTISDPLGTRGFSDSWTATRQS